MLFIRENKVIKNNALLIMLISLFDYFFLVDQEDEKLLLRTLFVYVFEFQVQSLFWIFIQKKI